MSDASIGVVFFIVAGAFIIGAALGGGANNNVWKQDTIDRGLAQYCPKDGQWAWVGECHE